MFSSWLDSSGPDLSESDHKVSQCAENCFAFDSKAFATLMRPTVLDYLDNKVLKLRHQSLEILDDS